MKKNIIAVFSMVVLIFGMSTFLQFRKQLTKKQLGASFILQVVTTNSILEDMVENIGQDKVDVYSIVKRGTDPHEYEPQPSDVEKTANADVIFHNGLNLETGGNGWFTKLVETSGKVFEKDAFAASQEIIPEYLTTNQKEVDPHAWLDLKNGMAYVKTITKILQEKDPQNATYYEKNAQVYLEKLANLHQEAQTKFLNIPEKQRLLVTSEGAFKYFSKAYKVTPAYIWEINTEAQGTPEQMQEILSKIRNSEVRHLFVETSVSPKSMEKVAEETGLSIYAKLFTDSLAQKGSTGDTYYTMMKWNLDKIYEGLTK